MPQFIHASDIHLAKPFGRFDEDTRAQLRLARMASIGRIGEAARQSGAELVLLAGDTFDAETPPPKTIRQGLQAMAAETGITWVLMPGNHDSLAATELWDRIRAECPENVILALEPKPIEVGDELVILPAPPTVRDPGRDLTAWMDGIATGERIRIGLAHGGVQDFGSEEDSLAVIPPDRAERAGLDYLALGDWHGRMKIGARTWYSGAPELDGFKGHDRPGCLLVDIAARGTGPEVTPVPVGVYHWCDLDIDLRPGDDPAAVLGAALPAEDRSRALVRLRASGRATLSERTALTASLEGAVDDFMHFESDLDDLEIEQEPGDLDEIDNAGALRTAANGLFARAEADGRSDEEKKVSRMALARLFQFAQEEAGS